MGADRQIATARRLRDPAIRPAGEASNPRNWRSRAVRVRTRSSTLGSRSAGASAAATGTCPPAASCRMAVATCRLERSLARHPSAPAASTAAVVAGWAAPARTSSLVADAAALTAASVSSRSPAGSSASRTSTCRLVGGGQLDHLAAVVGQPEHVEVVLGGEEHPEPLGDQHMVIGEQERHDIGHWWSPSVLRGGWQRGLAARAGRAGAPPEPTLARLAAATLWWMAGHGSRTPGRLLGSVWPCCLHEALLGLDRQVFGRPLVFERRLWGTPVLGHGPGALYRY